VADANITSSAASSSEASAADSGGAADGGAAAGPAAATLQDMPAGDSSSNGAAGDSNAVAEVLSFEQLPVVLVDQNDIPNRC
jgi:hypothetical protein